MDIGDIPPALMVACFVVFAVGLSQLARIQKEAIGHSRGISAEEADLIYHRDYSDGDGVALNWREIRNYCRDTGASSRLRLWVMVVIAAIGGLIGSVFLDHALR